ncbi:hypothetical protein ACHAXA_010721 [Cyclostephanos tholiformis]|uniref:RRM domain-containing protein n=1 Tax=Cyclostephanos tholiformis TaxID=382380 RepID=A0ABD3RFB8_9STRA
MGSKKRSRSITNRSEKDAEVREKEEEQEEVVAVAAAPPAVASPTATEWTMPPHPPDSDNDRSNSDDRASRRAARRAAKLENERQLLSKIPTHDDDGIPYGKMQLRRMKRRVRHGLPPIPTEEEEREIRERERREKLEEEALFYVAPSTTRGVEDDDEEDDDDEGGASEDGGGVQLTSSEGDDDAYDEEGDDVDVEEEEEEEEGGRDDDEADDDAMDAKDGNAISHPPPHPTAKKARRNKPVPPDYVCQACQNKSSSDGSAHWIYDCPLKMTKRGCNAIAKKLRGLHDPPSRKVFVSGLPFDCDEGMVKRFFDGGLSSSSSSPSSTSPSSFGDGVVHVKLLKFEDSKRCKGQAFLTFDTDEGADMAISKMNGSIWMEVPEPGTSTRGGKKSKKKGENGAAHGPKRELRLKVTRALNRFVTGVVKKKTTTGGRGGHENAVKRIKRKSTE